MVVAEHCGKNHYLQKMVGGPKNLVHLKKRTSNEIQQKPIHQCFVRFTHPYFHSRCESQGSVVPPRTEPLEGENAWNGVDSALRRSVTREGNSDPKMGAVMMVWKQ